LQSLLSKSDLPAGVQELCSLELTVEVAHGAPGGAAPLDEQHLFRSERSFALGRSQALQAGHHARV
jgi:hypothetical protein